MRCAAVWPSGTAFSAACVAFSAQPAAKLASTARDDAPLSAAASANATGHIGAGEKIPRKGGPGNTQSDLFVINKTDLAPHVGASLDVMRSDTLRMRGTKPFVMTNLKTRDGLAEVVAFIEQRGMLQPTAGAG